MLLVMVAASLATRAVASTRSMKISANIRASLGERLILGSMFPCRCDGHHKMSCGRECPPLLRSAVWPRSCDASTAISATVIAHGWPLLATIREHEGPLPHPASASQCNNLTFLVTEFGKPFTAAGFGNWFRDRCDAASLPQCAAHGLRKLAATRLAEAGCSHEQIKAVTGHRSDSALAPYIKKANKTRLARQALDLQLRAEGEQELSNLADPVGQKAG